MAAAPLFGGPRSNSNANRALFRSVLAATDALTMAWLLGQYAFQVRAQRTLLMLLSAALSVICPFSIMFFPST